MIIAILSFLVGAWVSKIHYSKQAKSAMAERDAWENKARQAQANMYSDIIKNSSKEIKDYEI
jgi:hypothetical protein